MAGDLDRAGRGPEALQAGRSSCRSGVLLLIRDGVLQDWERILSFFGYFGTDYI